jgi:hypothetical protein
MFADNAQPHPSSSDTPEASLRFGMMLAELWHDWFETMSQMSYQTHRVCEFFLENGGSFDGQHGAFDPRSSPSASGEPNGSVDMDRLKQCLQSMEPTQAARVIHAVHMMHAMETMLKRQRSRANEGEGTAW